MSKENITIEITKKDKIYLSIILGLVCAIICMAICLPRPYKVIEKEVPVYETVYRNVYDTKEIYIISPSNILFDDSIKYYEDLAGNKYYSSFRASYIETGKLMSAKVSIIINENGVKEKKELVIQKAFSDLFIIDSDLNEFGIDINIDYFLMANIKNLFVNELGNDVVDILEEYLFELTFENAKINIVSNYISE